MKHKLLKSIADQLLKVHGGNIWEAKANRIDIINTNVGDWCYDFNDIGPRVMWTHKNKNQYKIMFASITWNDIGDVEKYAFELRKTEYVNKNGLYHRTNGPAIIFWNGDKEWWVNGKLHRENGPAKEYADRVTHGGGEWWVNGHRTNVHGIRMDLIEVRERIKQMRYLRNTNRRKFSTQK